MNKTKEQKAQEYAKSVVNKENYYIARHSFIKGYTACEQSMWRSVEDELPRNDADILVSDENGLHIASYSNGEWYSADDEFTRQPQMWMPIPSLPDTK